MKDNCYSSSTFQNSFKIINTQLLIKMSAQIDCPICMDCIEMNKNCVTTECGHIFHASCLMKSVAHNGFGCPYCRTTMAEEPEDDESTEYETYDGEEDDMFDDNALRGFRFFFNNLNGDEHDTEDVEEEDAAEELQRENATPVQSNVVVPTTDFVAQKLREQGVTFEQLVKMICNLDHDEYSEDEVAERFSDELFGKIRVIVSNYEHVDEQVVTAPLEQHHDITRDIPPSSVTVRARQSCR
jgi:hypothetical protein